MSSIGQRVIPVALLTIGCLTAGAIPASAAHHRPRVSVHVYGGFGFGYPYAFFDPVYVYPAPYPYPVRPPNYSLVDTDISPEEAHVVLDGEEVGTADDFDGFPDYLEVAPGRHVIEFRLDGYRTLRVNLYAGAGVLYRMNRRLRSGDEAQIETKTYGNPRDMPRQRHEMRDRERPEHDEDWNAPDERPDESASPDVEPPRGDEEESPSDESPSPGGRPTGTAVILLRLSPPDGAVYVDGRFAGSGSSLAEKGLRLEPGRHTLEVVKPGFAPYKNALDIRPGEKRHLTVELEKGN